jgi:hypothetical protein
MRMRLMRAAVVAAALSALAMAWPVVAFGQAASVPATVPAVPSKIMTAAPLGQWALDFTLPTFGKSGCLVCHGDPKLVVPKGGADVSFWIDEAAYDRSAHARVVCTGCHTDFGYKAPHTSTVDWKTTSKQSCVACHAAQFRDYADGAHAVRPTADRKPDPKAASKPLCGDCHGGHFMARLKDNPAGKALLRTQGQQMCGREGCHKDYWDNYNDYYHGAAYKRGAADAPVCWDCHGAHTVIVSTSTLSPTNTRNIATTCGNGARGDLKCHEGASEDLSGYVKLIHRKSDVLAANPLYAVIQTVRSWFK